MAATAIISRAVYIPYAKVIRCLSVSGRQYDLQKYNSGTAVAWLGDNSAQMY